MEHVDRIGAAGVLASVALSILVVLTMGWVPVMMALMISLFIWACLFISGEQS